jgi:4-hydroxy-tetrahydrodipicolinate reductase
MGTALLRHIAAHADARIAGGSEAPGHAAIGQDVGTYTGLAALNLTITGDPAALFAASDVVVDFTAPAATVRHAALAAETKTALVAGTTGLSSGDEATLAKAAQTTAIVYAANMSVGVNLLLAVTEQLASQLDDAFDIEILEMHHRRKLDAPSGTALAFGRAAAAGRGVDLDAVAERSRDGHTGARQTGAIGFASLRGGTVAGEHTIVFAADNEQIEIIHRARNNGLFAAGALRAALWTADKPPGLYSMKDVLGL